jgi:trans-aconitate methyltransferase
MSPPSDYARESAFYRRVLLAACKDARTLLELGSGGGNNASHLKARFEMTLVDRSRRMLAVSRALNPECEHRHGDMRSVRLGREFDCVFVHDAICYVTTEADLGRVFVTAFVHLRRGGAALFAPDWVREAFHTSTDHGGHEDERAGMRYLEWVQEPDPSGSTYAVDYAYLLRSRDGSVRVAHDRHVEGLFSRRDWVHLLRETGFRPKVVAMPVAAAGEPGHEVFVARKP